MNQQETVDHICQTIFDGWNILEKLFQKLSQPETRLWNYTRLTSTHNQAKLNQKKTKASAQTRASSPVEQTAQTRKSKPKEIRYPRSPKLCRHHHALVDRSKINIPTRCSLWKHFEKKHTTFCPHLVSRQLPTKHPGRPPQH